jgi:hypothetical protein
MKRSSYVAINMGSAATNLFAIGMCLCLLPGLNAIIPGVIMGCLGLSVLLAMIIIWRDMTAKAPIQLTSKTVGTILLVVTGALILGVGMCLIRIWSHFVLGTITGIAGIIMPLVLVPLVNEVD